ncbi:MAG: YihY/virulence factor BrkB family protein [Nitrospirales bacterium]
METIWILARRVAKASYEDDIFSYAAQLGFYFMLALFPALLGITALLGMLPPEVVVPTLMPYAEKILPADSLSLVDQYVEQLGQAGGGGVFSMSLLGALWAASWGMMAIINSLNVVFRVQETRPLWKSFCIAILLTVGAAAFVMISLSLILAGKTLSQWVADTTGFDWWVNVIWSVLQWPVVIVLFLTAIDLIYKWAPNNLKDWQWVTPGSLLAVLLWILLSVGLKVLVENFINYHLVYGSITGVIILMMWLYLSGLSLLIGGELNAVLHKSEIQRNGSD